MSYLEYFVSIDKVESTSLLILVYDACMMSTCRLRVACVLPACCLRW